MIRLQESLGIHINKDRIILVSVAKGFKTTYLVGVHFVPGLSVLDSKGSTQVIAGHMKEFIKRKKISPDFVTLGVSRNMVIQRNIVLPNVKDGNIRDMLEFELEHHIPFPKEEIYFDFSILSRSDNGIELLLIAIRKDELHVYFEILKEVGLKVSCVELSYFANHSLMLFNYPELKDKNFIFIDFGCEDIEYSYFSNDKIVFSRSASISTYEKHKTPQNEETSANDDGTRKHIFDKLAHDIGVSLKCVSVERENLQEIMICGEGEADIESLSEHLRSIFKVPVNIAKPFKKMGDNDPVIVEKMGDSVGLGLSLEPFWENHVGVNLLPVHMREKDKKIGLIIFLILLAANLGLVAGIPVSRVVKEKIHLDKLNKQISSLESGVSEVEKLKKKIEKKERLMVGYKEFKARNVRMLDILQELTERTPDGVWINAFNTKKKGFEISGLATSASKLIAVLEVSDMFEKVQFSQPITVQKDKKERFKITFSLHKNAPAPVENTAK